MSEPLNIVIIEDEPVIARELARLLQGAEPSSQLLQILSSVQEGVEWFQKHHPFEIDLIFMDIRLGDGRSFEIFKQVSISQPVVFVTSYDHYALEAFKSNGLDYILKPFDKQDLRRALDKYCNWVKAPNMPELLAGLGALTQSYRRSFLVHHKDKMIPVESKQIAWIYSSEEKVYAQTLDNRRFRLEETLEQLISQLDPQHFCRANRQFIVQRGAIQEVNFFFNGRLSLQIGPEPPERVIISKARVPELKKWLNS